MVKIWFLILVLLLTASVSNAETVLVENDMVEAAYFFWKSENQAGWNWKLIGKKQRAPISLNAPDRFLLVARDLNGVEYHSGPVPLREIAQKDPGLVLRMSGVFATSKVWTVVQCPNTGQTYLFDRDVQTRVAVVFHLRFSDGTEVSIYSPRPN